MISVIVPVYNSEKNLKKCIESVLKQSEKELELLLINDGSTDKSAEICRKYEKRDKRVHVIDKENEGVSAARNTGILYAKGEYIQFVDSDDYLEPDMCKILLQAVQEQKTDFALCGFYHIFQGRNIEKVPKTCEILDREGFCAEFLGLYEQGFLNMPWNKLYRRDLISDYFETDLSLGEDLLFNLSYLENVEKISVVQKPLYHYIQERNVKTLSSKKREDKLEIAECICKSTEAFYHDVLRQEGREEIIYSRMVSEFLCDIAESVFEKGMNKGTFYEMTQKYRGHKYLTKINENITNLPKDLMILNYFFKRNNMGMLWFLCHVRKGMVKILT